MLQPRNIKHYTNDVNEVATDLVENMRVLAKLNPPGEMPDDFMNELQKFTLETVLFVALDKRFGEEEGGLQQQFLILLSRLHGFGFEPKFGSPEAD